MLLNVTRDCSLKSYNSFAIDSMAKTFIMIDSSSNLFKVLDELNGEPFLVLGGGSNLLLDKPSVDHPVLLINNKGIQLVEQTDDSVIVCAQAGENWHEFVCWTIDQGYGGLENLSLIPGNVGAAPVQNIGAYGVELKNTLLQVEVMNVSSGEVKALQNVDCAFGYRDSIFKQDQRGQWIILAAYFRLTRKHHQLQLDYGPIRQQLQQSRINDPTIRDVSNAVIAIRKERLPDPVDLPNAGSFFKNPLVMRGQYESLKSRFPDMPGFQQEAEAVKIPAAWMIEYCQWKGMRKGDVGVHEHHALVLVNYGNATGEAIIEMATEIQNSVWQTFGIALEFEVNLATETMFVRS